ncbi:hypothetical protein ACQ2H7_002513 [Candidozyma auris]
MSTDDVKQTSSSRVVCGGHDVEPVQRRKKKEERRKKKEERRKKKERRKRSRRKAIGFDPETLEDDSTELSRAGKFSGLSFAGLSGYGIFSGLDGEKVWFS